MPFHRRSFYASGKHGDWFEDQRISRMAWKTPPQKTVINIENIPLSVSSTGSFGNGEFHRIIVLENNCFSKVSWIDFCTYPNSIEHAYYNMRKEGYLFDSFLMKRRENMPSEKIPDLHFISFSKTGFSILYPFHLVFPYLKLTTGNLLRIR